METYRISKQTGSLMLFFAVVIDLIPALAFVLGFALMAPGLSKLGACAGGLSSFGCVVGAGSLFLGGALATTLYMIFLAPALYAVLSISMGFLGLVLYTGWFYFNGVPIWGFQTKRILLNVFTFIVELIPLVSLLPGVTFFVYRHIALSRREDKLAARRTVLRRGGRRAQQFQARREGTYTSGLVAAMPSQEGATYATRRSATPYRDVHLSETVAPSQRTQRSNPGMDGLSARARDSAAVAPRAGFPQAETPQMSTPGYTREVARGSSPSRTGTDTPRNTFDRSAPLAQAA